MIPRSFLEIGAHARLAHAELCVRHNQAALERASRHLQEALVARDQALAEVVCLGVQESSPNGIPAFLLKKEQP